MRKVILAFSGGLDTSYCAKYLSEELGYEVTGVTVNTGGFDENDRKVLKETAHSLGLAKYEFIDVTEEFYQEGIRYLIFGNVLKNNTYPLSVSAERIFQARAIAAYANKVDADAIAHGSTGAGNDQIRFDLVFQTLCPDKEIITPIRDLAISRETEIEYLKNHGVKGNWKKSMYSINQGLWGTSIGGIETLTSNQYLPEDAFPSQIKSKEPTTISLDFEKGEPVGLNGMKGSPVNIIKQLNNLAGKYAIGRDIHVGDTIIGIKGRVGFEAAASMVIIKAHHSLEKHVLTKNQLFIKDQFSQWYGNLMHEGQYLDPVMRDMESFLASSQKHVTGTVQLQLAPYHFHIIGITSDSDLMRSSFGTYGELNNSWSAEDAKGFARIYANQTKLYHSVHHEKN